MEKQTVKGPPKPMAILLPAPHREKRAPGEQRRAREARSGWGKGPCAVSSGVRTAKGSFWPERWTGVGRMGVKGNEEPQRLGRGWWVCTFLLPRASVCKGRGRGRKNSSCTEWSCQVKRSRRQIRKMVKEKQSTHVAAGSSSQPTNVQERGGLCRALGPKEPSQ